MNRTARRFHPFSRRANNLKNFRIPFLEQLESRALLAIEVTTFSDVVDAEDSVTSLREAITAANTSLENVEIKLPNGQYQLEASGAGENENRTGDLDIIASGRTVRIVGEGNAKIQGNQDRVFHVVAGTLELEKLDVMNGEARDDGQMGPDAHGGGILVESGSNLTVRDSLIGSNKAFGIDAASAEPHSDPSRGGDARGGGIYFTGNGTLLLEKARVNNSAAVGGRGGAGAVGLGGAGSNGGDGGAGGDVYGAGVFFGGGTMSMRGGWLQSTIDSFSQGARGGDGGAGAGGVAGGVGGQGGFGGKGGNGGNVYGGVLYLAGGSFEYTDLDSIYVSTHTIYSKSQGGRGGPGGNAGSGGGTPGGGGPAGGQGGSGGHGGNVYGGAIYMAEGKMTFNRPQLVVNNGSPVYIWIEGQGLGGEGGHGGAGGEGLGTAAQDGAAGTGGRGGDSWGGTLWMSGGSFEGRGTRLDGFAQGGQGGTGEAGGGDGGKGGDAKGGVAYTQNGSLSLTAGSMQQVFSSGGKGGTGGNGSDAVDVANVSPGGRGGDGGDGAGGILFAESGSIFFDRILVNRTFATGGQGGTGGGSSASPAAGGVKSGGRGGDGGDAQGGALHVANGIVSLVSTTLQSSIANGGRGGAGGNERKSEPLANLAGLGGDGGNGEGGDFFVAGTITLDHGSSVASAEANGGTGGTNGKLFNGQTDPGKGRDGIVEQSEFSVLALSNISGSVWDDFDRDHLQESEPRLPRVPVALKTAAGTTLSKSATDAGGGYQFRTNYREPMGVEFSLPNKYTMAAVDVNGNANDTTDSDADPTTRIAPVSVAPGANLENVDAGLQFELSVPEVHTYDATDLPQGNLKRVVSTIHVPDALVIQDLNVRLDIDQEAFADLEADLIAPDGTKVRLFERVTQNNITGPDFRGVLDDEAAVALTSQLPPLLGRFLPKNSLAAFDGRLAQGDWKLDLAVTFFASFAGKSVESFNGWSLQIGGEQVQSAIRGTLWLDSDGNGLRDVSEPLIDDAPVKLLDEQGNLVSEQRTDEAGQYEFRTGFSGTVHVEIPPLLSRLVTTADVGANSNDPLDSDFSAAGRSPRVVLPAANDVVLDAGFVIDTDSDGVSDIDESQSANNGDSNLDSVPDSEQPHVASVRNDIDRGSVIIVSPPGTQLHQPHITAGPGEIPPDTRFPLGVVDFILQGVDVGAKVIVELTFESTSTIGKYFKFQPQAPGGEAEWFDFDFDGTLGAEIVGNRVRLHLQDGGAGDADGISNGTIVDPGAPAYQDRYWQNWRLPADVNGDARVVPVDALIVINEINRGGSRTLANPAPGAAAPSFFYDASGDGSLAPIDALVVINFLNRQAGGEGEGASITSPILAPVGIAPAERYSNQLVCGRRITNGLQNFSEWDDAWLTRPDTVDFTCDSRERLRLDDRELDQLFAKPEELFWADDLEWNGPQCQE